MNCTCGSEIYTPSVLRDPNTGVIVTYPWFIAEHPDNTYPDKASFPKDTEVLIRTFDNVYVHQIHHAYRFMVVHTREILSKRSAEHFVTGRGKYFNQKLAEFSPEGPDELYIDV